MISDYLGQPSEYPPLLSDRPEYWASMASPCRPYRPPSITRPVARRVLGPRVAHVHQQSNRNREALSVTADSITLPESVSYTEPLPSLCGNLFHGGLQLGKAQEVHVAILLLIMPTATHRQSKCMKGIVARGEAKGGLVFFVARASK